MRPRRIAAAKQMLLQAAARRPQAVGAADARPRRRTPDYFGTTPNWAYSPPLRKFVDTLPGLGAGEREQPRAVHPGGEARHDHVSGLRLLRDRAARSTREKMHSDLPPTTLRGYVQVNNGHRRERATTRSTRTRSTTSGPFIVATQGPPGPHQVHQQAADRTRPATCSSRSTRTVMGAGMGPLGMDAMPMNYTQNRGDAPPPRRPHPVDQRRHAAPVDHARRREHAVPEGRQRPERARHARSRRRLA